MAMSWLLHRIWVLLVHASRNPCYTDVFRTRTLDASGRARRWTVLILFMICTSWRHQLVTVLQISGTASIEARVEEHSPFAVTPIFSRVVGRDSSLLALSWVRFLCLYHLGTWNPSDETTGCIHAPCMTMLVSAEGSTLIRHACE
jgi:hypothetical protein